MVWLRVSRTVGAESECSIRPNTADASVCGLSPRVRMSSFAIAPCGLCSGAAPREPERRHCKRDGARDGGYRTDACAMRRVPSIAVVSVQPLGHLVTVSKRVPQIHIDRRKYSFTSASRAPVSTQCVGIYLPTAPMCSVPSGGERARRCLPVSPSTFMTPPGHKAQGACGGEPCALRPCDAPQSRVCASSSPDL